ncbi:MAG: hypothetical protein FWC15_09015 [Fibromonadales bacterium]|nr:hypothetical protein [Fibromonadales bacterium]
MEQLSTATFVNTQRVNSLLTKAKRLIGISKKAKLIELSLEHLIKYQKRIGLIDMAGKVRLNVNLNATRGRGFAGY